jgi:uncharacterized protein with FMN-binding domain
MKRHLLVPVALVLCVVLALVSAGCKPKVFNDGTYKGISEADSQHGYAIADVTIQKDKITAVTLTEITELGVTKDYSTYPYPTAKEANTEMAKRFVGRQDANVDAYSGATSSSQKYKSAVSRALEKARKTPTVNTTYFDGTYFGRSPEGEQGYGIAFVTISGDKITAVKLDDVTKENVLKDWPTYPYTKALEAKAEMEKRFVDANSGTVDAYSGATTSSTQWIQAVQDALKNAKIR